MAETLTNTNGSFILRQATGFARPFYFGTTSQTVTVNLSKNSGAWAAAAGVVSEIGGAGNGRGWYSVALTTVDTSTSGPLGYSASAASGGPVDFCDLVQTQIFTDLSINANGQVLSASSYKQNQAIPFFPFLMTINGVATPGLTVSGQRDLGAGFSPIVNSLTISDRGNGIYAANLAASDTNALTGIFRFTSPGADDRDILLFFQP